MNVEEFLERWSGYRLEETTDEMRKDLLNVLSSGDAWKGGADDAWRVIEHLLDFRTARRLRPKFDERIEGIRAMRLKVE